MLIHSDQIIDGNACIFQDSCTVQVLGEYNCCVPAVKCGQAVLGRGAARGRAHQLTKLRWSPAQYSTVQYSTVQYSAVQYTVTMCEGVREGGRGRGGNGDGLSHLHA